MFNTITATKGKEKDSGYCSQSLPVNMKNLKFNMICMKTHDCPLQLMVVYSEAPTLF
jgi:hypothetical protein